MATPQPTKPPGFTVVEEEPKAANLLLLALKALSQRTIVAIADLFSLLTVASVWALWFNNSNPNVQQIVALGIYAAFVIAINVIVRRR